MSKLFYTCLLSGVVGVFLVLLMPSLSSAAVPVTLYDGRNYSGSSLVLYVGDKPNLHDLGFNDKTESFKIQAGYMIVIYEDFDYQGRNMTFSTDVPNLGDYSFDDDTSSIKVSAIPSGSITLDSPVGGEIWQVGSTRTIRWSCDGINKVLLYLYDDHTGFRVDIADNLDARCPDASYIWTIPASIPNGSTYAVYIIEQPFVSIGANSGYMTIGAGAGCLEDQIKPHKGCVGTTCQTIDSCGVSSCVNDVACSGGGGGGGGGGGIGIEFTNPLKYDTFQEIVNAIINFIYWIGVVGVAPVMLIIAGFIFVTSGGSPDKIKTAKQMILYTLIGVAILLFAKGLILVIKSILGVTT